MPGDRGNRYRQMAGLVLSRSLLQRTIDRSTRVSGYGRTGTFLIKEGGYWESISRIDPAVTRMEEFGYFFSAHDGAGDRRRKRLHIDGVLRNDRVWGCTGDGTIFPCGSRCSQGRSSLRLRLR